MYLATAETETEDPRAQLRRRWAQRRCLVCGARDLSRSPYFCQKHIAAYRYCSMCESLRGAADHGKDSRCKGCSNARSTAAYHAHYRDTAIYRIRLKQIALRTTTRGDQILASVRMRIWLADLVRQTPGMAWTARAAKVGGSAKNLAHRYRVQISDQLRDVDASDQARNAYWGFLMATEQLDDRDMFGARPHEYALTDNAWSVKCASCGAPMAFVKTPQGKAMPLSLATIEERDGVRYAVAHWCDCPQASEWSKKK